MNTRIGGSTLVFGVGLILAAACGKKDDQTAAAIKEAPPAAQAAAASGAVPASTPGVDPCSLLTGADVQEATGAAAANGVPNQTNPTVCDYTVGDGGILNVVWRTVGPSETADATMEGLRKEKIPVTMLAGVGDRSFFASQGYGMTQLNTFRGSDYVILTMLVQGAGEAKQKAAAQKLMEKALTNVK